MTEVPTSAPRFTAGPRRPKPTSARNRGLPAGSALPLFLALALLTTSGCHMGHLCRTGTFLGGTPILSGFLAAGPSAAPAKQGEYARSLMAEEPSPGAGSYILYSLVGAPRDVIALVLEPAGYTFGAVGGVALDVISLPFQVLYSGEYKGSRPVARGCVMAASFPFFIVSDVLCRSFTGDMNRYHWGVHPFPRADHRFFPNYHAILEPGEN